ncbi:MAG: CCA tRNA nucleotidyltransferase [Paludibacteraceae bacterium]|nr:CCA tRNA nucleotidyltransferase [Paludibacteraceae bacterium]
MKPMNLKEQLDQPIFSVISRIADRDGLECYVIGGYVRDLLLHRPSKDIDVVVVGSGIDLARKVAEQLGRGTHLSVFRNFGTAQVKNRSLEVEFVGARRESYSRDSRKPVVEDGSLQDDQNRRDFTINALALSLNAHNYGDLLDPFGGLQDLSIRIIRTPLDPDVTFSDDPLRMMRAIRFATQLGFFIEQQTFDAIRRNADRIQIISKERILDELNKIMMADKPSVGFLLLEESGLLPLIMPEIHALAGVETREGKGHKDNFRHTLTVLDNVAAKSDDLWLRWAALFHDVGKPASKRFEPQIGWTFHNHNYLGERMLPGIFRRMKLPMGEPLKFVKKMVSLHMRPIVLSEDEISDSALRRLLFEAGDDLERLMLLCEADITSKNAERVRRYLANFEIVRRKLKEIEEKDRIRNFQPPVTGSDIMRIYNLPPCATVGVLKEAIKNAILDGVISNDYDEAYAFMLQKAEQLGLHPSVNP